jgi:heme/copper-type cytochrome/quinol oxidase subunit 2
MGYRVLLTTKSIPILTVLVLAVLAFVYAPSLYKFTRFYDPENPDPKPGTFDHGNVTRTIRVLAGAMILIIVLLLAVVPLL